MAPIPAGSESAGIITEADLASYLQRTIPAGDASLVIDLANGLVTDIVGDLVPVPTQVKAITLEVAARGYRNPDAYSSVTTKLDDYDKTVRREGEALTRVGVYLTPEEEKQLLAYAGTPRRRVGSIRLQVKHVS